MKQNRSVSLITALIISGILVSYILQMSPAPFLGLIRESYSITAGDSVLNLAVSIIYPTLILASLFGSAVERRIGTYRMYVCVLVLLTAGILINFVSVSYPIFLIGRAVFGAGFGLGIPFIGSAIMQLYSVRQRQTLNTVNALFPFGGTLISFALLIPLSSILPGGWRSALGVWGFLVLLVLVAWLLFVRPRSFLADTDVAAREAPAAEIGMYRDLLQRREILLLCIIFMCDFFCYSYIVTILPTMLMEQCGLPESTASLMAALTFPLVGCIGCVIGGFAAARSGRRKPALVFGMALEVIGILLGTVFAGLSPIYVYTGVALFAFGNGYWLPVLYQIPMDLPDMNAARVGASFALMSICAFVCGFISPSIGGWLTDAFSASAPSADVVVAHAHGLRWSLFAFILIDTVGLLSAVLVPETGRRESATATTTDNTRAT